MQKFSVLMSVYAKEKPDYLHRAIQSIWDDQSVKPDQIILVQDGPLTDELHKIIKIWDNKLNNKFKNIILNKNVGLGDALNSGIQACSYELIARMDTDDIASKDRFTKQLAIFQEQEIDICGSWVSEFDTDENHITSFRKVPEHHNKIVEFSKKRNPLNHPAVMYKKSAVQKAGGYIRMTWFEDYYLWSRMLLAGARVYNIQEPLVNMRAGYSQLERRKGFQYAYQEFIFQKRLLKIGFINKTEFMKNIAIRLSVRILPRKMVTILYNKIRNIE